MDSEADHLMRMVSDARWDLIMAHEKAVARVDLHVTQASEAFRQRINHAEEVMDHILVVNYEEERDDILYPPKYVPGVNTAIGIGFGENVSLIADWFAAQMRVGPVVLDVKEEYL